MNNSITLNIRQSERLYALFKDQYSSKSIPNIFHFNKDISIIENLNNLSVFALHPLTTLPIYYSFNPIFIDLISRWIENPKLVENRYIEFHKSSSNTIKGSIVLAALSRCLGISTASLSLIENFLQNQQFFNTLKTTIVYSKSQIPQLELESILLSFYRLLSLDCHRFKYLILPEVLYSITQIQDESYNVSKYLSIQVLSIYLAASESSKNKMILNHIGKETDLTSSYENESEIDYKFIALIEAKRLSNFTYLPKQSSIELENSETVVITTENLSSLVTSVCGVLVPMTGRRLVSSSKSDFVPTESSLNVLRDLAHNIQENKPIMLVGKAGSGKTFLINELAKYMSSEDSIVKIHLGEQTDAKLLLGTYTSGDKPGTFEWRSGVLTTAVREGKWVLIEDIDKAPTEVLSVLLTLLEKRELIIPSRGETIKAKNGFQLLSTIRQSNDSRLSIPDLIGMRLWKLVAVDSPSESDLKEILALKFPLLKNLVPIFIKCFNDVRQIYMSHSFISLNKGSNPRVISVRDLMKFCSRVEKLLENEGVLSPDQLLESSIYDDIFGEAVDCFASAVSEYTAMIPLINAIGEALEVPGSRINLFLSKHVPIFQNTDDYIKIGRAKLIKSSPTFYKTKKTGNNTSFARTNHAVRLMEQIGVSIQMIEPVLLVGETGTGKTTVVQQVAKMMNKNLTVINVSQQTESGDLLGGYKPVNTKTIAVPLQEVFENVFIATFSRKKNEKFSIMLSKFFNKNNWNNVIKLWKEAIRMAQEVLNKNDDSNDEEAPKKRRKLKSNDKAILLDKWNEFEAKVKSFEIQFNSIKNSFVFNFVEGSLIKAVRNGDWLLLDEINLASPDTLESIADLLSENVNQRSVLLTEKGDIESIKAHRDFRIFGCMNPSTDVGKKDLPLSIRSRFTEIYVQSPDRDISDLLSIIDQYIGRFGIGDEWIGNDIAQLYLEAKKLSDTNQIVDGANQKPHFSIRTLTRTLIYVRDIVSIYGLRRSLYEGFCMSFLTLLDVKSEELLKPIIVKYTIGKLKNMKSVMSQCPPIPSSESDAYVQFRHYWMKRGPGEIVPQPHYIITPFVEKNMLNLVRATAGRRFPVLIQGPTSSGKTSMISYIANITGHKFVRINNHEHTDLQEYLGSYVSDSTGKLEFKEGILVDALRKGHWIVLDELNLAPTDVLEALNRLLDDNRELFIPETQEVIHPHPDFMLFATQNPPGIYGGRKILSRAFRNRFLELHFDDIPQDELETILRERCQIAPSYGKKIVEVYRQLSIQRQSTRLFEQKNSFATLRDLFRWAQREAVGYEELAANGYMLLAERVRNDAEKLAVKSVIEKVMKVNLDMDSYYKKLENTALMELESPVVWTKAMRRLSVLVSSALVNNEPLLLVGETGCGKTTVCQLIAQFTGKSLVTVNAHQNTETGDILGAQRPIRNRFETQSSLFNKLTSLLQSLGIDITIENAKLEDLLSIFDGIRSSSDIDSGLLSSIEEDRNTLRILFEWSDGPLVQALKSGDFFLLDEISLADDSVLERLNSVLEPERSLLLAEKGGDDSFITASKGFQFLATMNPGGDYGKKELSPALRNRFTEIWVPSMDDFTDVHQIVFSKLANNLRQLGESLVQFSEWFAKEFGGGSASSGVISLRDILAWVQFINSCNTIDPAAALIHGASMVFIDSLGTNNTAYLAENANRLKEQKLTCVRKLEELSQFELMGFYNGHSEVQITDELFECGLFTIPRKQGVDLPVSFNLKAPTTAANAMRVIRAMQVHKPILLEGSPGVGKTSLVSALASATGNVLTRINLSEQTDLVDLFGSDAPSAGGNTGEFTWRDAPFLRAMQRGEWVLLDEMNLASQSVLEGLNACLDHRGEAYIPELDKSFTCHPNFLVFAAQNPQYQGGGRKGLPKSFVNRFSVVYVDVLNSDDLNLISQHIFPNIPTDVCSQIITFISQLEYEVSVSRLWGSQGGPWEFNLRDTLRWLQLYNSKNVDQNMSPADFFETIIGQRFRSVDDKSKARSLFESVFGKIEARDAHYSVGEDFLQAGNSLIKRRPDIQYFVKQNLSPLQCNSSVLETAVRCINQNWPLILTGPANSGKTELIRFLGSMVGFEIVEFAMNSDVDSMDILGGYEQVDLTRAISSSLLKLQSVLLELIITNFRVKDSEMTILIQALELSHFISGCSFTAENFNFCLEGLKSFLEFHFDVELSYIYNEAVILKKRIDSEKSVKFEWFDGLLIKAVEKGNWLVLDNANLCSPSVLDRLNSLLEPNGSLIVNECSMEDGQPRTIFPHPNFRLFLTVDPKYGELSRAMRNRGIEIFMDSLDNRATKFDAKILDISLDVKHEESDCMPIIGTKSAKPVYSFVSPRDSDLRTFSIVDDVLSNTGSEELSPILSLLSFSSVPDISRWCRTVQKSGEFKEGSKEIYSVIANKVSYIQETGLLNSLYHIYQPASESADEAVAGSIRFQQSQSLNPLINSYIKSVLSVDSPFVASSEPLYFFELISSVFEASLLMKSLEDRASHGKVNDLSYIEKSAAVSLGRNLKHAPKLPVYEFVKDVSAFVTESFVECSTGDSTFQTESLYKSLFDLQSIWQGLLKCSIHKEESKLRVYQKLIEEWVENHKDKKGISSFIKKLTSAIENFGVGLNLTSGRSINVIWEHFRSVYPSSEESWNDCMDLMKIATEFDIVASQQFDGERGLINNLRRIILQLHSDILSSGDKSDEFKVSIEKLNGGLKTLSDISGEFLIKRKNNYQDESKLLMNFIESSSLLGPGLDWNEDMFSLALKAGKSTESLLKISETSSFKPYPSLFDDLWDVRGNKHVSLVRGLFTDDLLRNVLNKCQTAHNLASGNSAQSNIDLKFLAKSLINNSPSVLKDQLEVFTELLVSWFTEIVTAHLSAYANPDEVVDSMKGVKEQLTKSSIRQFYDSAICIDTDFCKIVDDLFAPALYSIAERPSIDDMGRAWVLFSSGCVQLFVPNAPYDPAITDHVLYKNYQDQLSIANQLSESWTKAREVFSGDDDISIQNYLPTVESDVPQKPRVFRPRKSIDNLFEEWKAFMESSLNTEYIQSLLEIAAGSSEPDDMLGMFQQNSGQFLMRLKSSYFVYSDLNDIIRGYIFGLKLGFDLLSLNKKNQAATYSIEPLWSIDIAKMASATEVSRIFNKVSEFCKSQSVDSVTSEHIMIYFTQLWYCHNEEKHASLNDMLLQCFQSLYYRWSLRRMRKEEEETAESSLYKYSDPTTDIDDDFKSLFPDHEDVMDIDEDTKSGKNNDELLNSAYYKLAKLYINMFLVKDEVDVQTLVGEGGEIFQRMLSSMSDFESGSISDSTLSSLVFKLSETVDSQSKSNEGLDFYRGWSTSTNVAISLITKLQISVHGLLSQWPEHATLQNIYKATEEFLSFSIGTPIFKLLQKIEQVYTFIAEWEKYSSRQVSLKIQFDELTKLIVSWRKLELSTWHSLFKHEDKVIESNIGKWWFYLFETIVVPSFVEDFDSTEHEAKLLSILNIFLGETTFGEFGYRFTLLKAFAKHVEILDIPHSRLLDMLNNLISFYSQFEPLINEHIRLGKTKLEKDIKEVILLASWKDVNIEALKQSSRRSHNNLYKIVRKYRSLLSGSITSIISSGISTDVKVSIAARPRSIDIDSVYYVDTAAKLCSEISTWSERPKRLQNMNLVAKNMEIYIKQISKEELPNLYDFAKSLMADMEHLRKETPSVYNEENKKVIAALKTQKRKLLSDTLKEVRRMGLKTSLRDDIHRVQSSVNLVLSNSKTFTGTNLEGSDGYFYRILDMMPRLRASVSTLAEDVPVPDAEKALAALENLMFSLIVSREPLADFSKFVSVFEEHYKSIEQVSRFIDGSNSLCKASIVSSVIENSFRFKKISSWLPKLLSFVDTVLSGARGFGVSTNEANKFTHVKGSIQGILQKFEKCELEVSTQATVNILEEFGNLIADLKENIKLWNSENSELSFIGNTLLMWLEFQTTSFFISSSTSLKELNTLEDIEKSFRDLSVSIILSIQKIKGCQETEISEDDDNWLLLTQQRIFSYMKLSLHKRVERNLLKCLHLMSTVEFSAEASRLTSALAHFTGPILSHYYTLIVAIQDKGRENYVNTSHATFMMATSFFELATKGFCSPEAPSETKESNNLEEGTGLGDGEGARNNSNDVEEDEDLSEEAQKPNEENKEKDDEDDENDDAVDIEGDMAGDLEDGSDQEKDDDKEDGEEDEELDEEIDDLDDLDPNAIDEKMWDEEAKDDQKEKDSDKMPEDSNSKEDDLQADEDQEQAEGKEEKDNQKDDQDQEDDKETDEVENDEEGEEEEDIGEQEDEVKNEENEQLDNQVPETETLDLPEDINLDSGDEGEEEDEENADDGFDDNMDVDMDQEEAEGEEKKEEENQMEMSDDENGEGDSEEEKEEELDAKDNDNAEEGETDPAEENKEGLEEDQSEDELGEQENEVAEKDEDNDDESLEGLDGADEAANNEDVDMETSVKQESGIQGEGADNEASEEKEDIGASGSTDNVQKQEENQLKEEDSSNDNSRDMAHESLKQLGDALKEFHRRHQEIKESSGNEEQDESKNTRPDEFEHIEGENTDFDTQALGAADKEQIQSLDEDKAIDDDEDDSTDIQEKQVDAMNIDEANEVEETDNIDSKDDGDFDATKKGAVVGERKIINEEDDNIIANEMFKDEEDEDYKDKLEKLSLDTDFEVPPIAIETARELWKQSDIATSELSSTLCEQLRLILEPTLATKLRGDYKTGKRLNMKRIIPYIASEFRKDKIWLRRTKPSKRQYQIMIAVDDSKSMSESKSVDLAFQSIALVSKALTQLEAGGLSIVKFGENTKVVHPFDRPFSGDTGAKVFQWFDFQQTRTDIKKLVHQSLQLFNDARASTNSDLWQLQIILSDGVCEDHETIQRLVRRAREDKVMLVFVVIDGVNSNESILDMSQVSYVPDINGNLQLKVDKYLDSFPFEFYVIVHDITELPGMLSLILRQFFSEVASI